MHPVRVNIIRQITQQLVDLAAPEHSATAQALQTALLGSLQSTVTNKAKRGPDPIGATILVGSYGHVICDSYDQAATHLGIKAASLSVRLSQGKGCAVFQRQDPETHNPMEVVVTKGKTAEHNNRALSILCRAPGMGVGRPRLIRAAPEPEIERDAIGGVLGRLYPPVQSG